MRTLAAEDLRLRCDPAVFGFETTHEGHALEGLLGQQRAEAAMRFGLEVRQPGFNLVLVGPRGTGKTTATHAFLEEMTRGSAVPPDWCYVHSFHDPFRPRALRLPGGVGRKLRADMEAGVRRLGQELPQAFETEDFTSRRDEIGRRLEKLREETFTRLSMRAQAEGFLLQGSPVGFFLIPVAQGRPIPDEEMAAMPEEPRNEILRRREALMDEVREAMKALRNQERVAHEQAAELEREVSRQLVAHVLDDVLERYAVYPEVAEYLQHVEEDMVANMPILRSQPALPTPDGVAPGPPGAAQLLRRYQVNLVVDNGSLQGAPVVFEKHPTPANLLGRIEREAQFGTLVTDFTMIRTGSLHQANGGYLVVHLDDLVRYPLSWDGLKRAIRDRQATVEELGERIGLFEAKSLRPEPIPWDGKVILIATPETVGLLRAFDPELRELFKVKADFDSSIQRTPDAELHYGQFVTVLCRRLGRCPFDRSGVAMIVEYAARLAGDRDQLSTRFGEIGDVITEAVHWAAAENSPAVNADHVRRALEQRVYRSSLIRDKLLELTRLGTLVIGVTGSAVGTVNGLTVLGDGELVFGRPVRITATVGIGREGLIDIEREVQLAGPIYSKAVMIIAGFLTDRYAQDKLLAIAARLVFEQTYGGVEGDSASCAEIVALMSRLAELPVKQGLAVTGSADQFGRVQAIGGVNEKIEGFFDLCSALGLSGDQGVVIPEANVRHLMLREDVMEAVRAGRFHVYAIETVDEGIELLTGVPAGVRGEGGWAEGSVNRRVDARLAGFASAVRAPEGRTE